MLRPCNSFGTIASSSQSVQVISTIQFSTCFTVGIRQARRGLSV